MSAKVRAFLALPLAEYFRDDVEELIELLKPFSENVKWVNLDQFHVTLHFFGEVDSSEIERIKNLVAPVADHERPLDISLSGVGAFPSEKDPRVVWTGVGHEAHRLTVLQNSLEVIFQKEGFLSEDREFYPHATLARLKGRQGRFRFPSKPIEFKTQEVRIDHLILFQSVLRPEGPLYEPLEKFYFNPSA